ncbi:Uma2 family endonuclease [Anaerolineales bacterium HSG6]|nr:Uma2 family endonuclease [Anaerolineales bacterium HSG6]MDM8531777.1 Uma2 family endonuclease [Anaerolineales bacterium HSG25]
MSALQAIRPDYSFADYLVIEEEAEYKSEYINGQIVAMAGASANHNRIASNLHATIYNALDEKPCETFISDLRVWIEDKQRGTYPEVMVVCGKLEFYTDRTDTITNPTVIIEVLSKSTAGIDRGAKFQAYWKLPSFAEYVLVDQYRVQVEYFRRVSEKEWQLLVFTNLDDTLILQSVGVELSLSRIYRKVVWEKTA